MTARADAADAGRKARWQQVDALLDGALDLDPGQRGAFLDGACAGNAALRGEVEQLLRCCGEASGFLESPARELGAALLARPEPGLRIGPYRTLGVAGRGGMGVVYLAERDDEHFRMRVAIKVLPRGMEGGQAVRRFLDERQILARLQHPSIARLLDGGVTDDGLPYFVMEYVEGTPLDRYADERALGLRERLALFCRVCEAVEYAHHNLVVHRDIKPANVLVTAAGEVKLLDFGIARLARAEAGGGDLTATGRRWMTPEFASPEQVRGEPVTTGSDVYALGVVLYRLLAGRSPYEPTGRTPHAVERAILEAEPPRPSDTVAGEKREDARRLRRHLRGDLDAIVLRAMRKEPGRRYPSAEALRQDVLRHLDGRPVEARPGTRRYRAGRFVRRHRASVAAAGVLLLSLLGGMGGTLWQARAAARQAVRAERVQAFLVGVFDQADPQGANGDEVTARQLLDEGARRVQTELRGEPETRARMLLLLGRIYRRLGMDERAAPMLDSALAVRASLYGRDEVGRADILDEQGILAYEQKQLPTAERLYRQALGIRQRHLSAGHPDLGLSFGNLATVLAHDGRLDEAEGLANRALRIDAGRRGAGRAQMAEDLEKLASILNDRGMGDSAIAVARRALAIRLAVNGPDRLETDVSAGFLARLHDTHGDFARAEALYRWQQGFETRRVGYDHRYTLITRNNLAVALTNEGKLADAEHEARLVARAAPRAYGAAHPFVAASRHTLAGALADQGRLPEAEALERSALAGTRAAYGERHPSVGVIEAALADVLAHEGRLAEADSLFRDALARLGGEKARNPRHTSASGRYGELLLARGRPAQAEPLLRGALALRRTQVRPDHFDVLRLESALGATLSARGRLAEAGPLLEHGYAGLLRERGPASALTARARRYLDEHRARMAHAG
jgi:serine/threonine-protein kinase